MVIWRRLLDGVLRRKVRVLQGRQGGRPYGSSIGIGRPGLREKLHAQACRPAVQRAAPRQFRKLCRCSSSADLWSPHHKDDGIEVVGDGNTNHCSRPEAFTQRLSPRIPAGKVRGPPPVHMSRTASAKQQGTSNEPSRAGICFARLMELESRLSCPAENSRCCRLPQLLIMMSPYTGQH